ncbi:response regulator [Halanaerobium hydrogeniformans]|uniref:Stage 0 sporulation protein A homolog n=1 Tax=Halanaerobium hydrogeniformans TaxID=656519 RepID=E4RPH7_HALHG|nr:response regulator [Halanaerobium hydrogeniformans]ADQ14000.1 response regulator receiver and SARP domain protein [Halanaerobium hydrogeniformans]
MLNAIIVDDEIHALERMKDFVIKSDSLNLLGSYSQAEKCLKELEQGKLPDVVFLDIQMPGVNGLELAQKIQDIDENLDVVFITAYDNYAVDAFELNALDYLLKPISKQRFKKTVQRLKEKQGLVEEKSEKIKVNSFGQLDLSYQEEKLNIKWPTLKSQELFLLLLDHKGNLVAINKLAGKLWPDKTQQKANNILYTTIYSLRKAFREIGFKKIITSKRGYYRLNLDNFDLALLEFETLITKIKSNSAFSSEEIEQLIKVYQGPYLEDVDYEWAYNYKAKLEKEYKDALLKAADNYYKQQKFQKSEQLLKTILELDFLFDPAQKKLIKLLKFQAKEELARMQYNQYRMTLSRDLGIELKISYDDI